MFLKRIELAGFKSFADKTELEFVPGITAVVGPNGSGKSNISDGIRWVLGEQSAKSLRGGKMEDIIFAGSDTRRAVNFSEVSLTLDNTDQSFPLDFNEVTVTRRVHRSGESEYYINKQSCRLKDITELFMDTGIGKEAYSIIGQGRIEEILSTRSEDRRVLFEEASGIVKYKTRKKEAVKKLDETEQNLLRIHDLVSALEDQIEPLRIQSEKAKQYKQLKEQLKTNEIAMYVYQIEQIYEHWTDANAKLQALRDEQTELSTIVSSHDADLEKHRWETRTLEEKLDRLHEALLRWSEEFEKCEGAGEVLKERRKNLESNRIQLEKTLEIQRQRVCSKDEEIHTYEEKQRSVSLKSEELQNRVHAEEARLSAISDTDSSLTEERLKGDLLETLNRIAQVNNEIRYMEQQIESLGRRMERIQEDSVRLKGQKAAVLHNRQEKEQLLERVGVDISAAKDAYLAASQNLLANKQLMDDIQQTIRKWEQKLDALVSRRDTMRELQNDYDGFQQGVKEVLKARGRSDGLHGIHGAIAELIDVPARYEIAVETALGGAMQHIVVENEIDGRNAIAYLKKRQNGRATFLPLDVIRGRAMADKERKIISEMDGYVDIAAELIRYDSKYREIMQNLLGNVVISETLEQANRIAARLQYRYRVVTLEGDVVNAGGSMTGGSLHKKSVSLLARRRQIEQLSDEIANAEKQLSVLQDKEQLFRDESKALTGEMEKLRQFGENKRIEEQQWISELQLIDTECRSFDQQLNIHSQDIAALTGEKEANQRAIEQNRMSLEPLQSEEERLQLDIRNAEAERKSNESAKSELSSLLTDLKVKASIAVQETQSIAELLRRVQAERDSSAAELEASELLFLQLEQDLLTNSEDSYKQLEQLNISKIKKQECADQIELTRAERAEWLRQLEEEENHTKEQRQRLKQVEEQLHQTEVKANRLDVELDNLLKKLSEDYELSFELAKQRYPIPDDVSASQNIIRDLKRHIAALGEVNLGAIDEYNRVYERFHFLSAQKQDLMEAKATLYQVIKEMDEEMSKRFRTTFEAIRGHFSVVFAKLFGGGRADLILSDPNNVLDTGIEIVAQPPGKKLQNLQLLSGGERALTAIALLFSILRVKPVPFCVLDEVEAALDEANVARFADYLREFSMLTQFIVVTHRKGTMEGADVLYGVTMEEDGVSKLVSVRLEAQDDAISA